ncbi:BON domain-containing protein [Xenorhabdus hominickii]|uniref:Osmotically-inducible protein Y n=1 Tax=Xenorhabdus hominickii TaxID=351679 RepID=A0A2G0Q8D5_XENHO|nr:BON domain-containing protein [Xenorhabdus hominickii]AOM41274.1 osmotically inducible protein Y [Xenorhabdus hominickii]PHM55472.1 osmotically inducible protein Y [Xenorhabdus hominickii]PHM57163.1 osmotically inducible protein Y [Xenorhabdus hominickii]
MKNIKFTHSLLAVVLGSVLISSSALAEESPSGKIFESAGQKIDSSLQHADNFLDDSTITAKVKGELLGHKGLNSNEISVKTEKGIVYLSGFVKNKRQAAEIAEIVHGVEGVKAVKSTLEIKK